MSDSDAKSYEIAIVNHTREELTRKEVHLDLQSLWSKDGTYVPPERIPSGNTAHFGSEGRSFVVGTQGYVIYTSSAGDFRVDWDNPFVEKKNSSSAECPNGIQKSKEDPEGYEDNATLKVTFYEAN
ncbi:hypothetical protein AB0H34_19125 [Saccharopolyspora shandongensis]|uniref:hypothetical protein n=1 Tax=Saccharopolyspora shandongensis TaxID=418495 RepID=UPI0033DBA23C